MQSKTHWIFILRNYLALWLIAGAALTVWFSWERGEEWASPMLYVGLVSWIAFISVIIASLIIKTESIKIQQRYDSNGKKSFVEDKKTGVFKNSNIVIAPAKKKSLTVLGMTISIKQETLKNTTSKIKTILALSLIISMIFIVMPLAVLFYSDVVVQQVGSIVVLVFGIFLLGSLVLISQLLSVRDTLRCPNRKRDDCKRISKVLYFPTFGIIGIAISILSFYLLEITLANMIIAIILSSVIQVAVTFTYLGITISRCSPCIYCRGKWSHDESCRYHVTSTN